MSVLLYGTLFILVAFFIQLVYWKINVPRNQTLVLLCIFLGVFVAGIAGFQVFSDKIILFGIAVPAGWHEYLQLFFYFSALTFAYIITYSAIEVDSPSLTMVLSIARAGKGGLDKDAFERNMGNDTLVEPRIRDLVLIGIARFDEGVYKLNARGVIMAQLFRIYRHILKRPLKGG